jgi:hypothetical protein
VTGPRLRGTTFLFIPRPAFRRLYCAIWILSMANAAGLGQTVSAPVSAPPTTTGSAAMETEVVVIYDSVAFPSQITRKQGQFVLHLINRTKRVSLSLVLESPAVSAVQASAVTQALGLGSFAASKRTIGLVNPPPGQYLLKSQASGKVFLTITIE